MDAICFVVPWNSPLVNLLWQGRKTWVCLYMFIHIYMSQYDIKAVIVSQKNLSGNILKNVNLKDVNM